MEDIYDAIDFGLRNLYATTFSLSLFTINLLQSRSSKVGGLGTKTSLMLCICLASKLLAYPPRTYTAMHLMHRLQMGHLGCSPLTITFIQVMSEQSIKMLPTLDWIAPLPPHSLS